MNIPPPGRKATITATVVWALLTMVALDKFEGTILMVVFGIIALLTIAYTFANVWQKSVLPVELDPQDTADKMDVSISNIHAELKNLNERVNGITNRIPPKTGAVDIVPK